MFSSNGRIFLDRNYSPPVRQVGVSPSPFGRGWRGAPGEGENGEMSRHACPHPGLPATFFRREKDTPAVFRLVNVLNSYLGSVTLLSRGGEECKASPAD